MTDIGVSCTKESYGRGAGVPLGCAEGLVYDAGLCYPPCDDGFDGVGPVCWGNCPAGEDQCGALCLTQNQQCSGTIMNISMGVLNGITQIMGNITNKTAAEQAIIQVVIGLLGNLSYPLCDSNSTVFRING